MTPRDTRTATVPTVAVATQSSFTATVSALVASVGEQVPDVTPGALDAASVVRDALVVVVTTATGRTRRRVYLNLPSAQRAVDRSIERGVPAELVLCRLQPEPGGAL